MSLGGGFTLARHVAETAARVAFWAIASYVAFGVAPVQEKQRQSIALHEWNLLLIANLVTKFKNIEI